ncbi:MAG: carbohydrate kinase family protein [Candidatus Nezhaarchaeales archaeon]
MNRWLNEAIEALTSAKGKPTITVMPDFFLDTIVSYEADLTNLLTDLTLLADQGGGSLPLTKQMVMRGGNAANTSSALARLGARVRLISVTSELGLNLLKWFMAGLDVDLSGVRCNGELSSTVSIELKHKGRLVNIMVSDPGTLAKYGPEWLTEREYSLMEDADVLCLLNWTANRRGTELIKAVLQRLKKQGKPKIFLDTGDPSRRAGEVKTLIDEVLKSGLIDALSVNENEALWYASCLNEDIARLKPKGPSDELVLTAARLLHEALRVKVYLHTANYSASFEEDGFTLLPTFDVQVKRVTGAGDAWNAGNVYCWALDIPSPAKLIVANAVAGYYISSEKGSHPNLNELIGFMRRQHLKPLLIQGGVSFKFY